jgi:hypothetical protein|tara:strand:+ start:2896 stop:3756 length:861 start_codon:yes stop_codon:yes gene_type:complete
MSNKIKHSKVRNTGILFELITRQITADIIENKDGLAVNLLKKYFSPTTQLGKEYELYKILTTESYKSESKANHLIEAVLKTYSKINRSELRREKYNLVSEIKNSYNVNEFFMARIPNYKVYASVYKLFESLTITDPSTETDARFTIIESITKKKKKDKVVENKTLAGYKKSEKDLRLLTYQVLVEKFNKKYKSLSEQQKGLLRKYINNISNTNQLKEFVEKESIKVKKQLQSFLPNIDDEVTSIKLKEAIKQSDKLLRGRIVEDNQVITLMRYYQLLKELKDVAGK